ncbi:MAG TPA: TonB-dependent receptor [Pyrinomonadaceae bacterium]|nr:TonB-dependent receptor [Pyrinomonadaceae bacterium]
MARLAVAVCAAAFFCAGAAARAQQPGAATLRGVVRDPAGAVVPGALVRATNVSTRVAREMRTNEEGAYVFSNMQPGGYEVRIESAGFKSVATAEPVALAVGQNATMDVDLEVAGVGEVVDLVGVVPLVDNTSSKVDRVINAREIANLPLNGRNFLELALLTPGNAPAPNFDPTKTNTVVVSSAGQFGRGGSVTVDGVDTNDDVVGGAVQNVSQDAVLEFQIATNRFDARLGRTGSGLVNIVTKEGTNDFHGSAAAYFRGSLFQGLPATFDRANDRPPFDREQYSFTLGGPLKKDLAFFFGSLEYRNQDGAVLVGARDTARRAITRGFADAPLDDLLSTDRLDVNLNDRTELGFRYSVQREEDVAASTLIRSIGSASQRQSGRNRAHSLLASYKAVLTPEDVNEFRFGFITFSNTTAPLTAGPQLTFPSIQDGASFRVPQATTQRRYQLSDDFTAIRGNHTLAFGGEFQRVLSAFDLGVFRQGRVELIEDFPDFDRNGDGRVDDNDLLFAVTLRSAFPERPLRIPDANNSHVAAYAQDDWRVSYSLTLNFGLRYELDTNVKNVSGYGDINPLVRPFLRGTRGRDKNNFAPRVGFNWSPGGGHTSVHGGYGVYYDRVTLEVISLERGLDGRALPIEVRAGNVFFIPPPCLFDPACGQFPPPAPTLANPFTGFALPGAGAGGINVIDNRLQNPMVQQANVGLQQQFGEHFVVRADYLHNFGTHFIIGRQIGQVFNPVVGGPDLVKNIESSVKTKYDGLLLSFEKRYASGFQFRASYTLSKAFNYANDDQIPFSNGPADPNNLQLEYGPTPNDQRHRFAFAGVFDAPLGFRLAPLWTVASGVPMDILLPDGGARLPGLQRNAGGRLFRTAAELNEYVSRLNAAGGVGGQLLPLATPGARFTDSFNSLDLRLSRPFRVGEGVSVEPIAEVFNLFNVTNVLGVSNVNYSGFSNVLARDSQDPSSPGFLRSSTFGRAVTTAGGVFGSGGPRAFQFAARVTF